MGHEPAAFGWPGDDRLRYLTQRGLFRADQLFVGGFGSNHPVVSNATPAGKDRNRRVELVVYPEQVTRS